MAAKLDHNISISAIYAKNNSKYYNGRNVQRFPVSEPLDFAVIDIERWFYKTTQGRQYTLEFTIQYFKLTLAIETSRTTAMYTANIPFDHWCICYDIST